MGTVTSIKPIYRLLLPLLVGTLVYFAILLAFDSVASITEDFFTRELLFCVFSTYVLLESNRKLLVFFERKSPKKSNFPKHSLTLVLSSFITSIILVTCLLAGYFYWFENMVDIRIYQTELKIFNGIFLFVTLMYQGHFLGFYLIQKKFERDLEQEKEEDTLLNLHVRQFHFMLNPGFLLTGLESILLRVKENKMEDAEEGILMLSDIYRYALRNQEELVSLQDELEAMRNESQFLNQFHFKNIQVKLPETGGSYLVIPRTLVKILEAISQSQLSSPDFPLPITIEIKEKQLHLTFPSQFSLNDGDKLFKLLDQVKAQNITLNEKISWINNATFSILIPLEKPYNQDKAKVQASFSNHNEDTL